jgi:hypothetical protein
MKTIAVFLIAGIVQAITIISPAGVGVTLAEVSVPADVSTATAVGSVFRAFDLKTYDQSFNLTVTGGSGKAILHIYAAGNAQKFDEVVGIENFWSLAEFRDPFVLFTPPAPQQGSVPFVCGDSLAGSLAGCYLEIEYGVMQTVRVRAVSVAGYSFRRATAATVSSLAGHTVSASTDMEIRAVAVYDPLVGWTANDNATVTLTPIVSSSIPESKTITLAGAGVGMMLVGNKLLRERSPGPGRR